MNTIEPYHASVLGLRSFIKKIQISIMEARNNLEAAQQRQKDYAGTKRPGVKFKNGDLVLLSTANLHITKGSTRKLLPRFMVSFSVINKINKVAMKFDLPNKLRMHNEFHVSLLRNYIEGKFPRSPRIPVVIEA
jgi:hypothetical protein